MNKSQLIHQLAERSNTPVQDSDRIVRIFFDRIKEALQKRDKVELRGFGSFTTKKYGNYTGRNPRTGESVRVGRKKIPVFKPGKELRERINASKDRVKIKKRVRKTAKRR